MNNYTNVSIQDPGLCEQGGDWSEMPDRKIATNKPDLNVCNNRVTTTNSNILTFVPLNIMSQLSKPANIYFVVIAILQMIPPISNSGGKPLVLIPLTFVISTVLIKDAIEEYNRYRKDTEDNSRPVEILGPNGYEVRECQEIQIGHIVRVNKDQTIPCDMVILQTSDDKGRSYVETTNLDGQNHLKVKRIPTTEFNLNGLPSSELYRKNYELKYERPNPFMHKFNGSIMIESKELPLNQVNLLLRGSTLKNVTWTSGVSVYTGKETKLSLNSVKFSSKRSQLDRDVNWTICMIFGLQFVLSIVADILNSLVQLNKGQQLGQVPILPIFTMISTWWLIMSYFVPISLIVTLEMVKFLQGKLLAIDRRMYAPMTNSMPMMNNSTINENLGRIKYVFSDKTGTLTSNIMNFKKISLKGSTYGTKDSLKNKALYDRLHITNVDFHDAELINNNSNLADCFELLALCNDIIVEEEGGKLVYSSSSPDEVAIANFAKLCGYELIGEEDQIIKLLLRNQNNSVNKYRLLARLDFSSDRKRMSVLVQRPGGQIMLYMKGADNKVEKLLKPGSTYKKATDEAINNFSRQGLRTLMLARRTVSRQEYQTWQRAYHEASVSLHHRQSKLEKCYQLIEKDMELVGCTAVEDKLQDGVSDTIKLIKACGIMIYILTGDKRETAVNIGRSCGIIGQNTQILSPPSDKPQEITKWLEDITPLPADSILLINASGDLPNLPLHSTICYRCTPTQKQLVVKKVKSQTSELTLAIGDGSNDVNMIISADVGVGIRGKEGNEACRVADFVIGQFSLLGPLVAYYGRQWNRRNSKLVNYNFFKNIYHVMVSYSYGTVSFFSGNLLFDTVMYQFYNSLFTSGAILFWAISDDEFSLEESLAMPRLYHRGQQGEYFNSWTYWKNIFLGAYHGIVTLFFVSFFMERGLISSNGRVSYKSEISMVIFGSLVLVVNLKVLLMSHGITPGLLISLFLSAVNYFVVYFIYALAFRSDTYECFWTQLTTPAIYLVHVFLCVLLLITDFVGKKFDEFQKRQLYHRAAKKLLAK